MNLYCSFIIDLLILHFLLVSETTSQEVTSSELKREPSSNQLKPTRLGKIVNLFRKTISKLRPTKKVSQKDSSKKILRKAIDELPMHRTSNDINARIHQLIPPHQVDRHSMEQVNSYENEVLSDDDTILNKLSSYAILSHSEPTFAKVVLSNPHYNKASLPNSSIKNDPKGNSVHSGQPFRKNRVNNEITYLNTDSARSNFLSGAPSVLKTETSESGIHHVIPINQINNELLFQKSNTGGPSVLMESASVPNIVTSGPLIHQVRYLPSSFQKTDSGPAYQLGLSSSDFNVSLSDSKSISSNYQGTFFPVVQKGIFYQESTPMLNRSPYQSSLPIQGDAIYQMSTPVTQSGTIYHMPIYQISQVKPAKPSSSPTHMQYRPYVAHPPSKTSGQFYKPVYTLSKNLFGKPLKPNTFVKQNMNKLMQTIYPYYHKPKFRYPYYDKEGNGKLLYGFGTPKLYEYNVFRPLGGYMKR